MSPQRSASLLRMEASRFASASPSRSRALAGQLASDWLQVGGGAITSSSLPRPRRATRQPRLIAASAKPPQWGMGSTGGPELSACCLLQSPIPRRTRDLAGPEKTKPRPTHAGADQGCAGRRGDGGWGEPARQRFNVRSWRGFRVSARFLCEAGSGTQAPLGQLSRWHRATPPGWSDPARNRPHCRWPGFAPTGYGPGAPGF